MKMPEGWKNLAQEIDYESVDKRDLRLKFHGRIMSALDLMKEMAEALEDEVHEAEGNAFTPLEKTLKVLKKWRKWK